MKRLTREWVQKAEGDFASAQRELRARKQPNYDAACFHSQQCVEKYLKARLQEARGSVARTHNLVALLDASLALEPAWLMFLPDFKTLGAYAVEVRYPGNGADKPMAREAVAICAKFRVSARKSLQMRV